VPKLARNLGLALEVMATSEGDERFDERREEIWRAVRRAVDDGRPAYGWHFEFAVIAGYDEGRYLLSGPVDSPGVGGPATWRDFGASAVGFVEIATVDRGEPADAAAVVRDALSFAVEFARSPERWGRDAGLAAYDNWIAGLESGDEISGDGAGYHAAVWSECRTFAAGFLEEARQRLDGRAARSIEAAARQYARVRDELLEVSRLFPPCLAAAAPEGLTEEDARELKSYATDAGRRRAAAGHVRSAKAAEEAGLAALEDAARSI
jgi:hypothetical protein